MLNRVITCYGDRTNTTTSLGGEPSRSRNGLGFRLALSLLHLVQFQLMNMRSFCSFHLFHFFVFFFFCFHLRKGQLKSHREIKIKKTTKQSPFFFKIFIISALLKKGKGDPKRFMGLPTHLLKFFYFIFILLHFSKNKYFK